MVRKKLINALLGVCYYGAIQAQPYAANLGTKTLYTEPVKALTKAPAGYIPVFINHVGRHGARHLTKQVDSYKAYQLVMQADSAGELTDDGKRLKAILLQLDKLERKNVKSISGEGVLEQQGIAKRLFEQNRPFFQQQVALGEIQVTKEIRTKQTAVAFVEALQQLTGTKDSVRYRINDTVLRFYDLSPAYTQFEAGNTWKNEQQLLKTKMGYQQAIQVVSNRFFTAAFSHRLSAKDREDFVTDLYGFYTILPSLQVEAGKADIRLSADSIARFFSAASLSKLGLIDQVEDYLLKGPGRNNKGIQTAIAAPLLAEFINATDACINTGKASLQLRFSHAETIAPFAALLQISGADKAETKIAAFTTGIWDAAAIVPLSANIQWILYKPKTGNQYLIKCLLNEREVKIDGLATNTFPYYNWQRVRTFYLKKLQSLHLSLSGNFFYYLQQLK